ncbi:MAG: efflux RND transporter permease subunit [Coxiella endosymbiont of Dermacentor silvarum]
MFKILKQYPGVTDVHTNLKYNIQQYAIIIKRDLAAVLGIAIQDIANTVSVMMSGNHWTDVQAGNKTYEVIVQMRKDDLSNCNALRKLYVRSNSRFSSSCNKENMIPISNLINLTPTTQGREISRIMIIFVQEPCLLVFHQGIPKAR